MSLEPVNDTASQWEAHFKQMAEGKLAMQDIYVVSVNQIGKGDGKIPKPSDEKIMGTVHDPTTGRLLDPVSVAANQTKEEIKTMKPDFPVGIKSAQEVEPAPKKKESKKSEDGEKKKRKEATATTYLGPDVLGD